MTLLGLIAVLLAAVGLYSVMAYSVAQRTQEIGVAGAALAAGLARTVASASFTNSAMGVNAKLLGGNAFDPLIYLAAAGFLCLVAALAAYLPARRAAAVDPMEALRAD
jgi:ABC-type antimicrobial peptide transport system permease subunit